jgi:hypothetical protein
MHDDEVDACAIFGCDNINLSPVVCRECRKAACVLCVIRAGKGAGGEADFIKCPHGCGKTLASLKELTDTLRGDGPWRWHASVVRRSLKRKERVAELEEEVRALKARIETNG